MQCLSLIGSQASSTPVLQGQLIPHLVPYCGMLVYTQCGCPYVNNCFYLNTNRWWLKNCICTVLLNLFTLTVHFFPFSNRLYSTHQSFLKVTNNQLYPVGSHCCDSKISLETVHFPGHWISFLLAGYSQFPIADAWSQNKNKNKKLLDSIPTSSL